MCLSKDSNYAFIGAVPKNGNVERLYKYDPATNRVVGSWDIPLWDDMNSTFCALDNNLLVGYCGSVVFIFDVTKGQIVWKDVIGKKIYSITMGPDNSFYVNYNNTSIFNYKIIKYNFNLSDVANIKATTSVISEYNDQDTNERTKPTGLIVVPGIAGSYDLYVSGLNSLYRIKV
jgi:hypothetical protein